MSLLDAAWRDLGEDPAATVLVRDHGRDVPLDSSLPVGRFVHDAIATASLSAALLSARRSGSAVPTVELDPIRVATAVTSDKHFRVGGKPVAVWAELSGFWPTVDGWVRTHANYSHHRARLLDGLGLPAATSADQLMARLIDRRAQDVQDEVVAKGGVVSVVRTEEAWRAHPQAVAVAAQPTIRLERLADAPKAEPDAPIRVLDLTRVIAGPVATRTLALWGMRVLRLDTPRYPEISWQHLDTGAGKRSALLDLERESSAFEALLARADVVVTGYRPGSLDRFGLAPEALMARHPGIVVARVSAWGSTGPDAGRRGFDSIVQAASGIAWLESSDGATPGALPAQALDHSAGYLLAGGITSALRRRMDEGGSWLVETSLARMALALLDLRRGHRSPFDPWQPTIVVRGDVTSAAAAAHFDGSPVDWATPAVPWGSSGPSWLD